MASRGVNKVILVGNLGKDPELRHMNNGDAVMNASLATSETWKDKQTGEDKEKTEWHNLVAYRKSAEIIAEYAKKGSKLYVCGRLQTRKWEDKNTGQDRYTTEIIINEFQFLDSRQSSDDQRSNRPAPPPANQPQGVQDNGLNDFDDDIPF